MPKRQKSLTFYRDPAGEIRWRLRAANGKPTAGPQEGYKRLAAAERGAGVSLTTGDSSGVKIHRPAGSNHGVLAGRPDVRVEWTDGL